MPILTNLDWENFLSGHPNAHILQTTAWGELKSAFGWFPVQVLAKNGVGAQILFRRLPAGFSLAYLPKGPIGGNPKLDYPEWDQLWPEIDSACRQRRAIMLKVEPDNWEGDSPFPRAGFTASVQSIQPLRTLVIDLSGCEDAVLARMKQKTRYNVRLAQKKGLSAIASKDVVAFFDLMQVTAERDTFGIHTQEYYQLAYERFHKRGECELLFVEHQGQVLSALMVFARGKRAWYFYGASSNEHRELMATYLVQWEAMRWAIRRGCSEYDLWGVPDADESVLEDQFIMRDNGLWGVYRFKRGFGGILRRTAGAWDRIYNPIMYRFYQWWITRNKSVVE